MASAAVLYTPEVLALAASLAAFPLTEDLPLRGEARSKSCGSALVIGLAVNADGAITAIGLRPHACAVGQASAAVFANAAKGRTRAEIAATEGALIRWLAGEGGMPDWPGLAAIAAAAAYPARHGAILLAWRAALSALPSA